MEAPMQNPATPTRSGSTYSNSLRRSKRGDELFNLLFADLAGLEIWRLGNQGDDANSSESVPQSDQARIFTSGRQDTQIDDHRAMYSIIVRAIEICHRGAGRPVYLDCLDHRRRSEPTQRPDGSRRQDVRD